jgi:hypothetical protein
VLYGLRPRGSQTKQHNENEDTERSVIRSPAFIENHLCSENSHHGKRTREIIANK